MRILFANPDETLIIGKQGETEATKIVFSINDLLQKTGDYGIITLFLCFDNQSYSEYPVTILEEKSQAEIIVTSEMLKKPGKGKIQLKCISNKSVAWSDIYSIEVLKALLDY